MPTGPEPIIFSLGFRDTRRHSDRKELSSESHQDLEYRTVRWAKKIISNVKKMLITCGEKRLTRDQGVLGGERASGKGGSLQSALRSRVSVLRGHLFSLLHRWIGGYASRGFTKFWHVLHFCKNISNFRHKISPWVLQWLQNRGKCLIFWRAKPDGCNYNYSNDIRF